MMKLRSDLTLRTIAGEHIIVDPDQGVVDMSRIMTLNDSAAWLWKEIQGKEFDADMMVGLLTDRYEVSAEQAQEDVKTLISLFEKWGLLET